MEENSTAISAPRPEGFRSPPITSLRPCLLSRLRACCRADDVTQASGAQTLLFYTAWATSPTLPAAAATAAATVTRDYRNGQSLAKVNQDVLPSSHKMCENQKTGLGFISSPPPTV